MSIAEGRAVRVRMSTWTPQFECKLAMWQFSASRGLDRCVYHHAVALFEASLLSGVRADAQCAFLRDMRDIAAACMSVALKTHYDPNETPRGCSFGNVCLYMGTARPSDAILAKSEMRAMLSLAPGWRLSSSDMTVWRILRARLACACDGPAGPDEPCDREVAAYLATMAVYDRCRLDLSLITFADADLLGAVARRLLPGTLDGIESPIVETRADRALAARPWVFEAPGASDDVRPDDIYLQREDAGARGGVGPLRKSLRLTKRSSPSRAPDESAD